MKNYLVKRTEQGWIIKAVIEIKKSEVTGSDNKTYNYNKIFIEKPNKKEIEYLGLLKHDLALD